MWKEKENWPRCSTISTTASSTSNRWKKFSAPLSKYTINFDLLVPEYSNLVEISVNDILQIEDQNMILKTGKRLGFRFEPDDK